MANVAEQHAPRVFNERLARSLEKLDAGLPALAKQVQKLAKRLDDHEAGDRLAHITVRPLPARSPRR